MTSGEIHYRQKSYLYFTKNSPLREDVNLVLMFEIAFQLAKMNERMDNEDKKFFGGLPSEKEKNKVQETKSRDAGTKQG